MMTLDQIETWRESLATIETAGEFLNRFQKNEELAEQNLRIAFGLAESEIEKLFLGSVIYGFQFLDPGRLRLLAPSGHAEDAARIYRDTAALSGDSPNSILLIPQAQFGRFHKARVDAFVFSPANRFVRVIVECDGYEFHS